MVLIQTPLVGIEPVDKFDQFGVVEAIISEQVSYVAPVFLLDMGVVVFLVRSRSGELHSWFVIGEVPQQVIVEELGAVITIEPLEFKGQIGFDVLDLFDDTGGAVVPCRPALSPSGVDIGECQAPDEVAGQGVTTVGDSVGLHEAGLGDIPVVSADGNLITQQAAWFGGTETSGASLGADWGQQSVNSGGAD